MSGRVQPICQAGRVEGVR